MSEVGIVAEEDRVVVEHPSEICLLGLLMRDMLAAGLRDPKAYEGVRSLVGDVRVQAGEMVVTLRFGEGRVRLLEGSDGAPRAAVRGTMAALLAVARGSGLLGPLLSGALGVGGNPFVLLRIMPLLRAPRPAGEPGAAGAGAGAGEIE